MVADGLTGKRMEWKLEVKDNEWKKKNPKLDVHLEQANDDHWIEKDELDFLHLRSETNFKNSDTLHRAHH